MSKMLMNFNIPEHQSAVALGELSSHLYTQHRLLDPRRKQLCHQLITAHNLCDADAVRQPPDGIAAIDGLKLQPGFHCILPQCDRPQGFRSLNLSRACRHRGKVHGVSHQGAEFGIQRVYLQTLFKRRGLLQWFIVTPSCSNVVPIHATVQPFLHSSHIPVFKDHVSTQSGEAPDDKLALQQAMQTEMIRYNAYRKMYSSMHDQIGPLHEAAELLSSDPSLPHSEPHPTGPSSCNQLSFSAQEVLQDIEEEEEDRLLAQEDLATAAIIPENMTCWNERTGWIRLFDGRPLSTIQHASLQPHKRDPMLALRFLGSHRHLVSPAKDEERLQRLMIVTDIMLRRCEATLEATDHNTRCWWQTYTRVTFYAIPFRKLLRPATHRKYTAQWKQLLCYLFRMSRLSPADRQELSGLHIDAAHLEEMQKIWRLLKQPIELDDDDQLDSDRSDSMAERRCASPLNSSELTERVFALSIGLLTAIHKQGRPFELPLIHYLAVMGIRSGATTFKTPFQYTPDLAGLLWTSRLLMLEYALPVHPYPHLGWLSRDDYPDNNDRMNAIRCKHLLMGGFHPIGEMLSLLRYGRKIARVEGGRSLISWSADGEQLDCNGQSISMTDFKRFCHGNLQRAKDRLDRLMFGLKPQHDLKTIKDEMSNTQQGFSFIQHPENQLERSYRVLLRRSWLPDQPGTLQKNGRWHSMGCEAYLDRTQRFLQDLMLLMHLTGGQPARGPELTTIKSQNSTTSARNIFLLHGQMMFVIEYHKARRTTNHAFYVVRYLPDAVGKMLFQYLVYVLPLAELIRRRQYVQQPENGVNHFLFRNIRDQSVCWKPEALTEILQQRSASLSMRFGISNYRQAVIAITKRHVRSIAEPFDIHDDKSPKANPMEAAWSWQACHRPRQNGTSYAVDRAYPTRLQPELLRAYQWVSLQWHRWLELTEGGGTVCEDAIEVNSNGALSGDCSERPPKRIRRN